MVLNVNLLTPTSLHNTDEHTSALVQGFSNCGMRTPRDSRKNNVVEKPKVLIVIMYFKST